ncbi:MAG: hypothetical protein M1833_002209 [Piccolia ochrophora]|nr:MAG: hypothetical protein M1833_002209 [Piccolia ochrophora]
MSALFCCSSISPFRPRLLDHEAKFAAFTRWASDQKSSVALDDGPDFIINSAPYAVQLVRQINYGPQESIRYFVPTSSGSDFSERTEDDLIESNFEKLNSYKNYRCKIHNKFFEVNLYKKDPINTHHWRSNVARPSRDIDLVFRQQRTETDSNKKMKEPAAEQEKKQEPPSSDSKGDIVFPEVRSSILSAPEETKGSRTKRSDADQEIPSDLERGADEITSKVMAPSNCSDMTTLKRILQHLLPTVGQSLGSSSLVSLLCLDAVSAELDLGLEFESLWEAELTSSNIIMFLVHCFAANEALGDLTVDIAEVEALVIPAMRYVDSHVGQQTAGRVRLREIATKVLEYGRTLDWVSVLGEHILRVIMSGPTEELLKNCRRQDDRHKLDRSNRIAEEIYEPKREEDNEEFALSDLQDDNDDDHYFYQRSDSDYEPMKDLTACDKECGYCGNCGY